MLNTETSILTKVFRLLLIYTNLGDRNLLLEHFQLWLSSFSLKLSSLLLIESSCWSFFTIQAFHLLLSFRRLSQLELHLIVAARRINVCVLTLLESV